MKSVPSMTKTAPRWLSLVALAFVLASQSEPLQAQQKSGFQLRTFQDESGSHKYSLFVPAGYTPTRKWPVILFLHGAGERGSDGVLPTTIGLGPLVKARESNFPFFVLFPQNDEVRGRIATGWGPESDSGKRALAILAQVEKDFSIDPQKEILSGWSMGAFGAWQLAAANPSRWLSVVAVSGGADPALAESLKAIPIWAFHGARDKIVRPDPTRKLVEAIQAAGGSVRYSESADGDHNVWMKVFDDDRLYAWMLSPTSDPATLRPLTPVRQTATVIPEPPFIPALDVPRAAYVRLGNDMLAALSDSIPQSISRESLTGYLNPISDYTEAEGYGFNVMMSGLSYRAQLARAVVKAYRKDRLNVQLGLSNVQVTIGGTSISGERHSASAGPINVVIGHVRPVWLSFDVTPVVVDKRLRLKLVATSFSIPNDNWYVTSPAGVSVSGFGMTRDKVSSALVNGLYGRKGTIELQVASVVPRLVQEMEQRLDISKFDQAALGSIWPLPVYQPRLKLWPSEVSTDEQGVSLVLGMTAAAVDPAKPPKQPRVVEGIGISASQVPQSNKLVVGIAPEVLAPLSELFVQADVARVHVADTPSQALASLADPQTIVEAIPDLKRFGDRLQVFSELVLDGPIQVVDVTPAAVPAETGAGAGAQAAEGGGTPPPANDPPQRFAFDLPRLKIVVSVKTDPAATTWTPCAEFDLALRHGARPEMLRPTSLTRSVAVRWDDSATITAQGRFVEGYQPQDPTLGVEELKTLFRTGWDEYVHGGPPAQLELPDLDFGLTKLRAQDAGWTAPHLHASFGPAGVKLTNSTDQPLVYETKGPYSNWGGPFTLEPGKSHDYAIAYPLVFRRRQGTGYQMYTLPAGSSSEYRIPPAGGAPALFQAREPVSGDAAAPK
ncbi:MAG: alpha/beta hydrolase-fold protein [Planctomycetales bacterium]